MTADDVARLGEERAGMLAAFDAHAAGTDAVLRLGAYPGARPTPDPDLELDVQTALYGAPSDGPIRWTPLATWLGVLAAGTATALGIGLGLRLLLAALVG